MQTKRICRKKTKNRKILHLKSHRGKMRTFLCVLALVNCMFANQNPIDATRDSYNETAAAYAEKTAAGFFTPEKEMGEFLNHIPEYGQILDVGCGAGRDARIFSELDYKVTGIDFASELLAIATRSAPKAHFFEKCIEDLSTFPSSSFNGVWANASLHHIPKTSFPDACQEMHRILQPGGILYISVKKGAGEGFEHDRRYGGVLKYWAYYSENEMVNILKQCGFEVINIDIEPIQSSYQTHPFMKVLAVKGNILGK